MMALAYVTLCVQAQDAVQLRRNQVGCYPDQEKVVVVEGVNPGNKMRIMTPDGRGVKAKSVRRAVSPLSGKTRYVVDLGNLSATGDWVRNRVCCMSARNLITISQQEHCACSI